MNRTFARLILILAIVAATSAGLADDFSLDWHTLDGGGAMNLTGGDFTLSGTIGQPDAGVPLTSGEFELVGGFWAGFTEQPFCFGDFDDDGVIGLSDLAQLLGYYGETSGMEYENGDLDGDGDVDLSDLAALLGVYGDVCP